MPADSAGSRISVTISAGPRTDRSVQIGKSSMVTCRVPRALAIVSVAPRAARLGGQSAAGIPAQIFPPRVTAFRTATLPRCRAVVASTGKLPCTAGERPSSAAVTVAPSRRLPSAAGWAPVSSPTPLRSTTTAGRTLPWRSASTPAVPPARTNAESPCLSRTSRHSARLSGRSSSKLCTGALRVRPGLSAEHRGEHLLACDREGLYAGTGRVRDRVGNGSGYRDDGGLAGALRPQRAVGLTGFHKHGLQVRKRLRHGHRVVP